MRTGGFTNKGREEEQAMVTCLKCLSKFCEHFEKEAFLFVVDQISVDFREMVSHSSAKTKSLYYNIAVILLIKIGGYPITFFLREY